MNELKKTYAILSPAERKKAILIFLLTIIGVALETCGVGMIIPVTSMIIEKDIGSKYPALQSFLVTIGNPSHGSLAAIGMALLLVMFAIKSVYLIFLIRIQTQFSFEVQAQLGLKLFSLYIHQPYSFHLQRNSSQLIRNVNNEVTVFCNYALRPAIGLLTEILIVAAITALLFFVEPVGTTAIIAVMVAGASAIYFLTRKRIEKWGAVRLHHDGLRVQSLQEGLGGAKDAKLLGREKNFIDQFHVHNSASTRVSSLHTTLQQTPRHLLEFLGVCSLGLMTMTMVWRGEDLSHLVPTLAVVTAAAVRFLPSLSRIMSNIQALKYGIPVIETLASELLLESPKVPVDKSTRKSTLVGRIELRNLKYTYSTASTAAVENVSISIGRGQTVGIIGPSGSGKSTLVDLILGLLSPSGGNILIDGRDIQDDLREWQDQIGYVPQSIFLTDDSLLRNIAFGLPPDKISKEAVIRALKAAQLEEFISELPDGLDTVVGERGVRLSGGQRQRIGIARALYHDPEVLVLDEATSALDGETEKGVMAAVSALHGVKTIIIVAHRLSTVSGCDRLYKLDRGLVVREGSFTEVVGGENVSNRAF